MKKHGRFEAKAPAPAPKRKKNTGSRLLLSFVSSIVSLLLCCTMFLGTTMAWFTDSVTSAGNQITIGELEVGVLFNGQSLVEDPRTRMAAPKVFDGSFRWAPDHFEARSLTIQNSGDLDIQYVLNLLIDSDDASVAEYFDVYVYTGSGEIPTGPLKKENRGGWEKVGNLAEMYTEGKNVLEGVLEADETLTGQVTSKTIGFALHMLSDVKTEEDLKKIAGQTMTFSIKLNAYQVDTPEDEMENLVPTTEAASEPAQTETPAEDPSEDSNEDSLEPLADDSGEDPSEPSQDPSSSEASEPSDEDQSGE